MCNFIYLGNILSEEQKRLIRKNINCERDVALYENGWIDMAESIGLEKSKEYKELVSILPEHFRMDKEMSLIEIVRFIDVQKHIDDEYSDWILAVFVELSSLDNEWRFCIESESGEVLKKKVSKWDVIAFRQKDYHWVESDSSKKRMMQGSLKVKELINTSVALLFNIKAPKM